MVKLITVVRAATIALAFAASNGFAALVTSGQIYMTADPGSWVGGGLGAPFVVWTHGVDGVFSVGSASTNGVTINYQGEDSWSFDFHAPLYDPATNSLSGQPLKPGLYDMATRYPFNSPTKPGINISGAGRGNNQESGWFQILDISFTTSGDLERLAVNFKQFDENLTESGPWLFGALRINSTIPVPEPESYLMLLAGLGVVALFVRRRANAGVA
jgi:hypothetical protein